MAGSPRAKSMRLVSRLCVAAWLAAAVFAAAPRARADTPAVQPTARIVVIGSGKVSAPPDYADVTCGVVSKAKTAKEATDTNSKTMNAIVAALRDAGIDRKDIQTAGFSLQPVYAPPQPNTEPRLTGFSVSNQFRVTIRDIQQVGGVLDRLIAAGATDVGNVAFEHGDPAKLLDQARAAAIADARRQAEVYARAAGLTLGAVVFISEDSNAPVLFAPRMALRAAAAPAIPIAIGEDSLTAQVTVGFDVAP